MRLSILALLAALTAVAYAAAPKTLKNRLEARDCIAYQATCAHLPHDPASGCCEPLWCHGSSGLLGLEGVRPRASTSALLFADRCVRIACIVMRVAPIVFDGLRCWGGMLGLKTSLISECEEGSMKAHKMGFVVTSPCVLCTGNSISSPLHSH